MLHQHSIVNLGLRVDISATEVDQLRVTKSVAGTLEPIVDSLRDRMWDIAWAHQSVL